MRRPELRDKGLQGRGGHSIPELGDKCRHREANVKVCKRHAAQSWETNNGLQGRGGYSSLELGDKCKGLRGQMYRIARQRRTQQPELGDKSKETNVKDCRAEQSRAGRQM